MMHRGTAPSDALESQQYHTMEQTDESKKVHVDSHARSLIKGLTWRFLATTTTTVIAFFVTGHIQAAIKIGAVEFLAKLFLYYAHERLWLWVPAF